MYRRITYYIYMHVRMPYLPAARTCPNFCSKIEMRLAMRTFGPLSLYTTRNCCLSPMPDAIRVSLTSSASPGFLDFSDFGCRISIRHPASKCMSSTLQCPKYEALDQSPNRSSRRTCRQMPGTPCGIFYPLLAYLAPSKAVVIPRLEERTYSSILNFEGYICVSATNFHGDS